VAAGDRVVVALRSGTRFAAAVLAVRLRGAVLVNCPWQWRRELVAVAEETDARAVLLDPERIDDDALAPLASRVPRPATATAVAEPLACVPRAPDAVAWLAYSGGTTGAPKGAVHSERTLTTMVDGFRARYGVGPDDPVLVAAPLGHAVGLVYGLLLALRARALAVVVPRWDARAAAALVARHGCTFAAAPTPFLLDLVEHAERRGPDELATLRHFLSGGASVPQSLRARARRALPRTQTSAYYATSECGAVVSCPPDAPLDKVLATEGVPLPGMEARVERGELLVRGAQLASGYWGEDRERRFRDDGWYATGDLATLDADGWLSFAGRVHDVIRRGGVDVSPAEVEDVLAADGEVREVAVLGLPDARLGQRVAAAVVARGATAPTLEQLRERCRLAGLAKVKWPERAVVVDALPRTPAGKVRRDALVEIVRDAA
jgi:acyl-CoA synthetase (AMP-forming)/AMP-acid ligase II